MKLILFVLIKAVFSIYDSYLNSYKSYVFSDNDYNDIANSTWKEYFISENIKNLVKCLPVFIDDDKELDLLVLDSATRLYWISNVRGTSKEIVHQFISQAKLYDFVVSDSINNVNMYILGINSV
jgi:hypothetical protein